MTIAPCGVVCELCIGYQRPKNKCVGCLSEGNKPKHCTICSIKLCSSKASEEDLCLSCSKYPCRRLRDLEKRYSLKYSESPTENMKNFLELGRKAFESQIIDDWSCKACGELLSVHRPECVHCGAPNPGFPKS